MTLRIITAPSGGPDPVGGLITLSDAKTHLNSQDFYDDDDLISGKIMSATRLVEARLQRRYLAQVVEWVRNDWCRWMVLPIAASDSSKISIDSIKYYDQAGVQQILSSDLYWDRPAGDTRAIVMRQNATWPCRGDGAEPVVIRFTITGTQADIPDNVKDAVRVGVAHFYDNRTADALPAGIEALLESERWEHPAWA